MVTKLFNSVFVGAAVAMCAAATPVSPEVSFHPSDTLGVVPKTGISSKMRFVFAVGLEGTGHHYVVQVLDHLFQTNPNLVKIAGHATAQSEFYTINYSMGEDAQHYSTALSNAREDMRRLAQRGAALQYPGTVVSMHGRNSYPMKHGPNKALNYLDLRLLAEMAEEEGMDLRVLYLRRPVKDLLIADTVHREFQSGLHNEGNSTPEKNYMEYMQILLTDIAVVHSFLAELGPGFVVCHDFDRLGNIEQSAAIANFLAPTVEVAELLKSSLVAVAAGAGHAPSNESLLYEGADVVASRLQRKFDAFEAELCSGV